jgi:uncharacterized damage-inducible protein DinB
VADRQTPFSLGDERQTLVEFLDYLRESVIIKASGLPEEQARTPGVPSGTSLMGLVKHLTLVEIVWFQHRFAGEDVWVPHDALGPDDRVDHLIGDYRAATARSNEIVATCDDLGAHSARPFFDVGPLTLRWILVHMVEETARHAGHADILRERIDGSVGR